MPLSPWTWAATASSRASGRSAPAATGRSARPARSRTRSAFAVVFASVWFPCTVVTPSSSTSGLASASRSAIASSCPGSQSRRIGVVMPPAARARRERPHSPKSSMLRISSSCGSVPWLYLTSKRGSPSPRTTARSSRPRSRASRSERPLRPGAALELLPRHLGPSRARGRSWRASRRSAASTRQGLPIRARDVAVAVHTDGLRGLAELLQRAVVEVDVRARTASDHPR